jgi:hypothetical protein
VVTVLGLCRNRAIVHATPTGMASATSKITGMIAARTYATRCGRCTAAGCDAATNTGESCGGGHLGSALDMRNGSQVAIQVPGYEGSGHPARLACDTIEHLARITPAALEQRAE